MRHQKPSVKRQNSQGCKVKIANENENTYHTSTEKKAKPFLFQRKAVSLPPESGYCPKPAPKVIEASDTASRQIITIKHILK